MDGENVQSVQRWALKKRVQSKSKLRAMMSNATNLESSFSGLSKPFFQGNTHVAGFARDLQDLLTSAPLHNQNVRKS